MVIWLLPPERWSANEEEEVEEKEKWGGRRRSRGGGAAQVRQDNLPHLTFLTPSVVSESRGSAPKSKILRPNSPRK